MPGLTPLNALATNKVGSIMGTTTSAVTYYRRVHPDLRTAVPMAVAAPFGVVGGAALAAQIPAGLFRPIIVAACVAVLRGPSRVPPPDWRPPTASASGATAHSPFCSGRSSVPTTGCSVRVPARSS